MNDLITADADTFELLQRKAKMLASTDVIPARYKNNLGNIIVACDIANRQGWSWLAVMQSLYVIQGEPRWKAEFLIGCFNGCGRFGPLTYELEGFGDDLTCTACSTILATGQTVKGPPVSIGMAKAEGWYERRGSKWQTLPELMLRYRAATFLIRTVAPDLTLGMYTTDEVADFGSEAVIAAPVVNQAVIDMQAEIEGAASADECDTLGVVVDTSTQFSSEEKLALRDRLYAKNQELASDSATSCT